MTDGGVALRQDYEEGCCVSGEKILHGVPTLKETFPLLLRYVGVFPSYFKIKDGR